MLVVVVQVPGDLRLHNGQCLSVQISEVDFFHPFSRLKSIVAIY